MEIRTYAEGDRETVLRLTPRLTEGVAPWRDPAAVCAAVHAWVENSLAEPGTAVFVAVTDGALQGFVTVTLREHWSGGTDGYLGELVVAADAEGSGVGRALVERARHWARERGATRLGLETGAANAAARAFYAVLGFEEEDVRLSRAL